MLSQMLFGKRRRTGVSDMTTLMTLVLALAIAPAAARAQPPLEGKLVASDGVAGDAFGSSVAISKNTAVVGARGADPAGAAYVFERDRRGGTWIERVKLAAPGSGTTFGSSVAIDGDLIVVGAPDDAVTGRAYVYGRNQGGPGTWGMVTALIPHDDGLNALVDRFGESVSISGRAIIVGAPWSRVATLPGFDGLVGPGAAYIFERDHPGRGQWRERAKIAGPAFDPCGGLPSPPCFGTYVDRFGNSVDISGNTVVVGGVQPMIGADIGSGAAHIFERNKGGPGAWGRVTGLALPPFSWDMPSSSRVAISGHTVIASQVGPMGPVGIFERNEGGPDAWGLVVTRGGSGGFTDLDTTDVAIDGKYAVVSALASPNELGAAIVFSRNQGGANNWGRFTTVLPSDPGVHSRFGRWVAIDGQTVVVSDSDPGDVTDAGAAYACRLDAMPDPDSACLLTAFVVNRLVSVVVAAASCCGLNPAAPVYTVTATFTNSGTTALGNFFFEVIELSGGNLLRNADGAPVGVGGALTPDLVARGGDGLLSPGETVTVTFEIGLATRAPFRFVINAHGDPQP